MEDVCSAEHLELSMDGLAQSAALLKNDAKTLPLTKGDVVAVIGPQANMSSSTFGYYGPSHPCGGKYLSLTDAVAKYGSNVQSHLGIPEADSDDLSGIPAAAKLAAAADKVVMALGVDLSWAHEGHDSTTLEIPAAQVSLVEATTAAAKSPVTVVIFCANPLDISSLLSNPKVGAVIHVGQPSITIYGIAEVLFGMKSPAGRTIQTIYPASYADEISIFVRRLRFSCSRSCPALVFSCCPRRC
jgi:xylan 1,4-beta-xylosidase